MLLYLHVIESSSLCITLFQVLPYFCSIATWPEILPFKHMLIRCLPLHNVVCILGSYLCMLTLLSCYVPVPITAVTGTSSPLMKVVVKRLCLHVRGCVPQLFCLYCKVCPERSMGPYKMRVEVRYGLLFCLKLSLKTSDMVAVVVCHV